MARKKGNSKSPSKKSVKKSTTEVTVVHEEARKEGVQLTPRQARFLQLYHDPQSPTWGNARQSCLAAGFGEDYANQITYHKPQWFMDFYRNSNLIDKIEKHFAEVMELPNITQAMGAFGPIEVKKTMIEETGEVYKTGKRAGQPKTRKVSVKVPVYVPNVAIIKAKNEVAKIAAPAHDPERYGRKDKKSFSFSYNVLEMRNQYKPT